jgi:hypothetical protein
MRVKKGKRQRFFWGFPWIFTLREVFWLFQNINFESKTGKTLRIRQSFLWKCWNSEKSAIWGT